MPRSRTSALAGEAPLAVAIEMPLPVLDVLADRKTAFLGLCLTAGQQVSQAMMEHDRGQLCGAEERAEARPRGVPGRERAEGVVLDSGTDDLRRVYIGR